MPKLDPGRLIRHARDLIDDSKKLCERSRHAIERSKRLKQIIDGIQDPTIPAASIRSSTNTASSMNLLDVPLPEDDNSPRKGDHNA